ncbi:surface lipoprotein assembly modifier [Neisseria wadsworthii]|uniref:surface lipoprotein assembly modifier n=1 Tax=Neisseria wadsworthii TaxID=607711 RepID=UPI002279E36A|nr:surface lipoprotein assembly modifier [Neisseria wadsworthii]
MKIIGLNKLVTFYQNYTYFQGKAFIYAYLSQSNGALPIAGMKPTFTFKHRRVNSNVKWMYQYRQNEVGLSLVKMF